MTSYDNATLRQLHGFIYLFITPSFFLPFMAQVQSVRAMKIWNEKTEDP